MPLLRYQNNIICDHLAGQYVAGVMTSRVRSRMETLMLSTPELDRAVSFWADEFSVLHEQLPPLISPSKNIWQQIDKKITSPNVSSNTNALSSWWQNLWLWKTTGVAGIAMSLVLATLLFFQMGTPLPTTVAGANYMAAMSPHNDSDADIQFVISAYAKQEDKPSKLHVQWSKRHTKKEDTPPLHLWAEDKDSGQLAYIGVQPSPTEAWNLTKPSWQAIANSGRLLMTSNNQSPTKDNTLFSGPCVQLGEWTS